MAITFSLKNRFKVNLLISLFVFAFLCIFEPFNTYVWSFKQELIYSAGYGFCTFAGLWVVDMVASRLNMYPVTSPEIRNQLIISISHIVLISILNFFYSVLIGVIDFSFYGLLIFFGFTLAIGIFPSLALIYPYILQKKISNSTESTNGRVNPLIHLSGENEGEKLEIPLQKLYFIKSELNYCEVYYQHGRDVKKAILRAAIKNLEKQIDHHLIVRCHRSYICNLAMVQKYKMDKQRLSLRYPELDQPVYCARSKSQEIKRRLNQIRYQHHAMNH